MALDQENNNLLMKIFEALHSSSGDPMRSLLETVLNTIMKTERDQALNASPYERSDQRIGYAHGFKDKTLNTRMGALELKVPQTRGVAFYPASIEKGDWNLQKNGSFIVKYTSYTQNSSFL
jgi:putative transposase